MIDGFVGKVTEMGGPDVAFFQDKNLAEMGFLSVTETRSRQLKKMKKVIENPEAYTLKIKRNFEVLMADDRKEESPIGRTGHHPSDHAGSGCHAPLPRTFARWYRAI